MVAKVHHASVTGGVELPYAQPPEALKALTRWHLRILWWPAVAGVAFFTVIMLGLGTVSVTSVLVGLMFVAFFPGLWALIAMLVALKRAKRDRDRATFEVRFAPVASPSRPKQPPPGFL